MVLQGSSSSISMFGGWPNNNISEVQEDTYATHDEKSSWQASSTIPEIIK